MKSVQINTDGKSNEVVTEKSILKEIFEWVFCIIAAFVIAVLVRYFLFTPTLVKQTSMTPTILDGERVLINRTVRTFKLPIYRGDIITFEMPAYTENGVGVYEQLDGAMDFIIKEVLEINKISFIKRVIAIGGDHLQIKEDGVYVNGRKQSEVYLDGAETPITGSFYDVVVPEGYVFVMGDNRDGSCDSREFGCIPIEKVEGRVVHRIWPISKFGKIDK